MDTLVTMPGELHDIPGLDPARLEELEELGKELGADLLGEVTAALARAIPDSVSRLHQALSAPDLPQVADLAHKLKGTLGNVGARAICEKLAQVEASARSNDLPLVRSCFREVERELRAVVEGLARCVATDGPAEV